MPLVTARFVWLPALIAGFLLLLQINGYAGESEERAKPEIIERLRSGGELTPEERNWVDRVIAEKRISRLEFADHLDKCWQTSEEYAEKNISYTKNGQKVGRYRGFVDRYGWLPAVAISLGVGLIVILGIFTARYWRQRRRCRSHATDLLAVKTASELFTVRPKSDPDESPLPESQSRDR